MLKVLIADDEIKVIQLILHLIHWEEFDMEIIGTTNDGKRALEIINEEHPDVVITDIRMPGISGIELAEMVRKQNESIYFIIVSGYSQFDYAQKAVKLGVEDYLLKPIKKKDLETVLNKICIKNQCKKNASNEKSILLQQLSHSIEIARSNLLADLIIGQNNSVLLCNSNDLQEKYGCIFNGSYFLCIIAHLYSNHISEKNEEYSFILPKLQFSLQNRLQNHTANYISIQHHQEIICLLNIDDNSTVNLLNELQKINIDIACNKPLFPNINVTIGIGSVENSLPAFEKSYHNACYAIQERFMQPDPLLSNYHSCHEISSSAVIPGSIRKALATSIELADYRSFKKNVNEVIVQVKNSFDSKHYAYNYYRELAEIFLFGIKNYTAPNSITSYINLEYLLSGLEYFYSLEDAFNWLSSTCAEALENYAEAQNQLDEKPIRLAKQYITENYNKLITLEIVSRQIGFNPAYFSSMFKKMTGQNFMDYLTEIRITNAQALLSQTDKSIADIAYEVGYSDIKYFSKLFRKYTKLNPTEFRKLYGKL